MSADKTPSQQNGTKRIDPQLIQLLSHVVDRHLPENCGFILIVAPYNKKGDDVQVDYTATVSRESAVAILKSMLFRWGINEEWMKKAN